jgi:ribose transport system permease protein
MKKLIGITIFLVLLYAALLFADPGARSAQNHFNLGKRIGLYGILSLAAGLLIITGGIDLSMGSVVGLTTTALAILMTDKGWPPLLAMAAILGIGAVIGLVNGLLVTQLRLQAFVVTLCGLFIYRGAARWIAKDQQKGFGTHFKALKNIFREDFLGVPMYLVIFVVLALAAAVFLHLSVYGRYFYAIGSNERAARYSGIPTKRYKILAYVLCSTLTALFAILYMMEANSAQPSGTGEFFELYAIAGAVLGGCSLRGGEGTVLGIVIGTAILWILPNLTNMWGVPSTLEYAVLGGALLVGALLDEILRPRGARRLTG